ncbi:MAG: hypothetical protein ACYC7D_14915 [Nitrososphaerales archaeon]
MSDIITVRVDPVIKKKLKKYDIDTSKTVREALAQVIRKKEREELENSLEEAGRILRKIPENEPTKLIRESRDER